MNKTQHKIRQNLKYIFLFHRKVLLICLFQTMIVEKTCCQKIMLKYNVKGIKLCLEFY